MSRLPRTVSEVMRVFETMRPRLEAAVRPAEECRLSEPRDERVRRALSLIRGLASDAACTTSRDHDVQRSAASS